MLALFPNNWFAEVVPLIKDNPYTILGSISQMKRLKSVDNLIVYHWDMYSWQDYSAGEWAEFGKLCQAAVDIWYPSIGTKEMTKKIYGVDKGVVIKTFAPTSWVRCGQRGDYVLLPMRYYVHDRCFDWAKRACEELNLPFVHPNHDRKLGDYISLLANCNMIISPYAEASTGGLGMIEASKCGKPVLANASPLNGAREYMGDYAEYFNTYEELKEKLWEMYHAEFQKPAVEHPVERMAEEINARLSTLPLTGK